MHRRREVRPRLRVPSNIRRRPIPSNRESICSRARELGAADTVAAEVGVRVRIGRELDCSWLRCNPERAERSGHSHQSRIPSRNWARAQAPGHHKLVLALVPGLAMGQAPDLARKRARARSTEGTPQGREL